MAEKFDERPDPWFDRLAEVFWQSPGLRGYIGGPVPGRFDGEVAAHLTRRIIEEAAEIGDCVIVGRGSQCILQQREDAFHVFIYAPRGQRLARLLRRDARLSKAEAEKKLDAEDATRAAYVRDHYRRRLAESPSVSFDDFLVPGGKRGGFHYSFGPPQRPGRCGSRKPVIASVRWKGPGLRQFTMGLKVPPHPRSSVGHPLPLGEG